MQKDTILSAVLLVILAFLFASVFLYFYAFISIVVLVILVVADVGSASAGMVQMRSDVDSAKFDHRANAGSYVAPVEHLGASAATVVEWPFRMFKWVFGMSKYENKEKKKKDDKH